MGNGLCGGSFSAEPHQIGGVLRPSHMEPDRTSTRAPPARSNKGSVSGSFKGRVGSGADIGSDDRAPASPTNTTRVCNTNSDSVNPMTVARSTDVNVGPKQIPLQQQQQLSASYQPPSLMPSLVTRSNSSVATTVAAAAPSAPFSLSDAHSPDTHLQTQNGLQLVDALNTQLGEEIESTYGADEEEEEDVAAEARLSKRALHIIRRVDEVIRTCTGETAEEPTEDELAMFEVFTSLRNSPIGPLFVNHPEVSLSNRSCVITTPDFHQSEPIDGYLLRGAYNPGTIGRSYFATKEKDYFLPTESAWASAGGSNGVAAGSSGGTGTTTSCSSGFGPYTSNLAAMHANSASKTNRLLRTRSNLAAPPASQDTPHDFQQGSSTAHGMCVLKAVSFVLRKDALEQVIAEQRALVNLNHDNVLKVWDVLNDEYQENMIVVANYHPKGNICAYAGTLDNDGEKFCHIVAEIGVGLRVLHSHRIYHHNLKLDNILETTEGHYCIADAGFSRLFTTQCPEALVFNGELACLPPEVFDENGSYADDSVKPGGGMLGASGPGFSIGGAATSSMRLGEGSSSRGFSAATSQTGGAGPSIEVNEADTISRQQSSVTGATAASSTNNNTTVLGASSVGFSGVGGGLSLSFAAESKVDIWGFGVLMYRLAFGKDPFEIAECSYEEVRERVVSSNLQFPHGPWSFSRELEVVIAACLEKNPQDRPTILRLLRYPFFKDCMAQSFFSGRNVSMMGAGIGNGIWMGGGPRRSSIGGGVNFASPLSNTSNIMGGANSISNNISGRAQFVCASQSVGQPFHHSLHQQQTQQMAHDRNGYLVVRTLGHGRCTETLLVHLRRDPNHFFAFKIVTKSVLLRMQKEAERQKLEGNASSTPRAREIKTALAVCKKARHPNILPLLDIVDGRGSDCFAVQEYMQDGPLTEIPPLAAPSSSSLVAAESIQSAAPAAAAVACNFNRRRSSSHSVSKEASASGRSNVPPPTLQKLLRDVLAGLIHLHDNGVAHLCLLPTNIFYCKNTGNFRIADFGPLFLTVEELMEAEAEGSPIYSLPDRILSQKRYNCFLIDTLFVGLLAASIVPDVFNNVWSQLICVPGYGRVSTDAILVSLNAPPNHLPPQLCDFVMVALTTDCTARQLYQHHFLAEDGVVPSVEGAAAMRMVPPVVKIEISAEELEKAVMPRPALRDENRMREVLGHDPFQDSQMLSSMFDLLTEDVGSASIAGAGDRSIAMSFRGANLRCGQCNAEVPVALYTCPDCYDVVRCGKCAVNDAHADGHSLVLYVIHTIEVGGNGESRAVLVHPSAIHDVHALETLEMSANFPVGSLSAHLTNQRAMERSLARSIGGTTVSKLFMSTHSSGDSDGMESTYSVVTENIIKCHDNTQGWVIQFPAMKRAAPMKPGLLMKSTSMMKTTPKRVALPKEEELMEDETWQQELEKCRDGVSNELLLYNYNLEEVPMDIYNPPPLNVVELDLSQNCLTDLPHELSFLVNLRKMVVSYNRLIELPESLGNLQNLETFDASHNMLTDLPQTFIYLTNLESIAMDYNNCKCIPDCLLEIVAPPSCDLGMTKMLERASLSTSVTTVSNLNAHDEPSPRLSIIYLAANDNLDIFPDEERLKRFRSLKIALDNEPSLYKHYMSRQLETTLPSVTVNWNKIYPDEIIPHLYCGSLRSAQSQIVYEKLKISYVLTVGRGLLPVPPEGGKHQVIIVDDIPGADIFISIQEAVDFIDESQQNGVGCLVHCFAGLSRSATTVIAYLMMRKNMRLDEAYLVTKKGRPAILPNKGFFEQLVQLDKKLFPGDVRPLDFASLERPPE